MQSSMTTVEKAPPSESNKYTPNDTVNNDEEQKQTPSVIGRAIDIFKYIYSSCLLIFCLYVVSAAIFTKQTTATGEYSVPPVVAFLIFWVLILWLSLMEGGLNCMVGLQPIDGALYAETHPFARACTARAHKGDNIERFIVGRQFLDLMVVFVTSFMVSAIDDAGLAGLPDNVSKVFLDSGLAVILVTIVFGQLTAQVNSAHYMLDFINNIPMQFTTYAALIVELSGLLHTVYLIQIIFSKLSRKPIDSNEPPRSILQKLFFWVRVLMSVVILALALSVTIKALFEGKTTMWANVPPYASIIILVALVFVGGMMEAMQIALFALVHLPQGELEHHPVAHRNCQLAFRGQNLQSLLIGRQILQTIIMFVIARITTVDASGEPLFEGMPGLGKFLNTGLVGAFISAILASLAWRVLASSFPVVFLANPFAYIIIHLCLLTELSGVCSAAWLIAAGQKRLLGYRDDEIYIGTAEDRAAKDEDDLQLTELGEASSESEGGLDVDATDDEVEITVA